MRDMLDRECERLERADSCDNLFGRSLERSMVSHKMSTALSTGVERMNKTIRFNAITCSNSIMHVRHMVRWHSVVLRSVQLHATDEVIDFVLDTPPSLVSDNDLVSTTVTRQQSES